MGNGLAAIKVNRRTRQEHTRLLQDRSNQACYFLGTTGPSTWNTLGKILTKLAF
jgi:hypothetical protein